MIDLQYIRNFYPTNISGNPRFDRLMLKEYLQLLILDYLQTSKYAPRLTFIGGTCLRHVYGIDRFSEDLDFDCKQLTQEDFMEMTDDVITYLQRNGVNAVARDKNNSRLTAFRRNIYFPELLFDLNLSGHRDERLLVKIKAQDQGIDYEPQVVTINKLGFTFLLRCAPADIICSMKIAALLGRGKGRDFYDLIFLSSFTYPNFNFLRERCGITDSAELKTALDDVLSRTDLQLKRQDFAHLVIDDRQADKILLFSNIIPALCHYSAKL